MLYDDRDKSPGAKFAAMDLIGLPDQLILGPRGLAAGTIECKNRRTGARQDLPPDAAIARLSATCLGGRLPTQPSPACGRARVPIGSVTATLCELRRGFVRLRGSYPSPRCGRGASRSQNERA